MKKFSIAIANLLIIIGNSTIKNLQDISQRMEPLPLKLVVVGDGAVGKTSMLVSYYQNKFPKQYEPTVFDNNTTTIKVDGKIINLGLWDTAGQEEYARLRPLAYTSADIFLIVFEVTAKSTFNNAIKKWYPEVHGVSPTSVFTFVGNKIDLREGAFNSESFVKKQEALQQLKGINCLYQECSALTRVGLKEVFQNSVKQALKRKKGPEVLNQSSPSCPCQLI